MNYPILPSRAESRSKPSENIFLCGIKGIGIALLFEAVLLILSALILSKTGDPFKYLTPVGLLLLFMSAYVSGFSTSRFQKDSPLLCGIVSGGFLTLLSIIGMLFFIGYKEFASGMNFALILAIRALSIGISILGAFSAAKKTKKKRASHRRKKIITEELC